MQYTQQLNAKYLKILFHSLKQQVETIGHKHEDAVRMWLELERRINELDNK